MNGYQPGSLDRLACDRCDGRTVADGFDRFGGEVLMRTVAMRTEGMWQGERRAARMHWLRQVLDKPLTLDRDATFDEVLRGRFGVSLESEAQASPEGYMGGI